MMLSRSDFVSSTTDLKSETVEIEGMGSVMMRELSVIQRKAVMAQVKDSDEEVQAAALVAATLYDESGPWFTIATLFDGADVILGKSVRTVSALNRAFAKLHGVSDKDIEEAAGNSTAILSEAGSSGSQETSDTQRPALSAAN